MIPVSAVACQDSSRTEASWQSILQGAVRDPIDLCRRLALSPTDQESIQEACQEFPLRVPEPYLTRMEIGNALDPLLLQVLPQAAELQSQTGFISDPLDEKTHNPVPGLIHKYASRVLFITTSLCAIHCRYCFRRDFPYEDNRNSRSDWLQALDYVRQHPELNEVILSGGDPLSLPDRQLSWLTEQIADIPHIKRLRIHTRLPVVIPQRITNDCLDWMTNTRLKIVTVLHSNHPNEIDTPVSAAIKKLHLAGVVTLNQSVLLRSINDNAQILATLSEKLFDAGCLPYYLHALDPVRGSQHFSVPDSEAVKIHINLQATLPGFLVPRLVRENAGHPSKSWLV